MACKSRRALGLTKAPSDTSLYRLLAAQKASGFGLMLVRQVKEALLRKWISNDLFPHGVVSIDGKSVWSGHYPAHRSCRESKGTGQRGDFHILMQRACLVSSRTRLCVTQTTVAPDAGE